MATEYVQCRPAPPVPAAVEKVNLAAAVRHHAEHRPRALAASCEGRSLDYGRLARQAAGLAAQLASLPGWPSPDDEQRPRVGILASRSLETCVAMLGANWAGATYVPIGLKLPEERILTILSLCRLSAIVADEQGAQLLGENVRHAAPPAVFVLGPNPPAARGPGAPVWLGPEALEAGKAPAPVLVRADSPAYVIFTSGTTGVPKGVVVPAGAVRHYVRTITAMVGLMPSDRALATSELTFDFSVHDLYTSWEAGASVHLLRPSQVMNAAKIAREHELTVWNSVPSLVGMLRQLRALGPGSLPRMRLALFGGEALSRGVVEAWRSAAPGSEIHNIYGPTEATVFCLTARVDDPPPLAPGRDVVAIGRPMPGTQAMVVDAAGDPVPDGSTGELALAGVQLATGYLGAPELTAARFPTLDGRRWYLTGDLSMRDASGTFHCFGRIDNQVKVLGYRVELEEVDAHLRQVTDRPVAAAVAWPVMDGAAQGVVGFVCGPGLDERQTLQALKARLPTYMVPSRVLAIETMPVNASGKVDRRALRQMLESGVN